MVKQLAENNNKFFIESFNNFNYLSGNFNADNFNKHVMSSIKEDSRLYATNIDTLLVYLKMLIKRQVINVDNGKEAIKELNELKGKIVEGQLEINTTYANVFEMLNDTVSENTRECIEIAMSPEEQLSCSVRMWVRDACDSLTQGLQNVMAALIEKSESHVKTLIPSVEKGQISQPVSLAFKLMSYVNLFARDKQRLLDCRKRLNESPVGCGTSSGTAYNINREMTSRLLGYSKPIDNTLDAVASRDYVIEFLAAVSCAINHITQLSQEYIDWASPFYGFISLPKQFTQVNSLTTERPTHASLEMLRANSGSIYGALINVLTITNGNGNGFSNDLYKITEPLMNSYDTLLSSLNTLTAITAGFRINRKQMKEMAGYGYSVADDVVCWFVRNTSMSHFQAKAVTEKIINYAIEKGKKLSLIELDELQAIEPKVTEDIYSVLISSRAVISRRSVGGANPVQVRKVIRAAKRDYLS